MIHDPNLVPVDGQPGVFFHMTDGVLLNDNGSGRLVKMDLGTSDVHVDTALANFATGYTQKDFMADVWAPPVPVAKKSDVYYEFSPDNALATVDGTMVAAGGNVPEVTPTLSTTSFATKPYALAGFLPTETLGNQDAIVNLQFRLVKMVMDRLLLNREVRVKTAAFTTGNYTGAHLKDLSGNAAVLKWNGGTGSDPVRDIQSIMEAALLPITGMILSLETWNAFATNSQVQKYLAFKSAAPPLPGTDMADAFAALLRIPKPYICEARAKSSGLYPYVWANDVALFHQDAGMADGYTNATAKTFRWNVGLSGVPDAGGVPGASQTPGFTVRSIYNPYRGPRGGMYVVVAHDDAEQFITQNISGLIHGAFA